MTNGTMDCKETQALIPSYHDGELTEAQAAPLRQHLMDCPDCRRALAGQKAFNRWFPKSTEEVEIPPGFAQRVARRAFAGDTGSREPEPVVASAAEATVPETPIFSFVLWATSAAAGLLLIISGMLFQSHVGGGDQLHADGHGMSKSELLEQADRLQDPAGETKFEATPLEDMSDKGTKLDDSGENPAGRTGPSLENGGQ